MEITVSQEQGRVPVMVFHLKGDLMSDDQLRIMAHEAFDAGARNILLDLTKVQFMSSLGLRALHHIYVLLRGDEPGESDEAVHTGLANGTYRSPHFKLLNEGRF
jgi:anti-anti-sigma factor